ncbi:hypothetical protein [Phaeodactylibacter sp.]|uniref:hypothetical protein n=1 Tax=Phaeodactylibacter sp. TaxID=1940289 RepID=UPI0025DF2039|nr:hypothetical protein [Phaeodactylibacter sp.]MCI4646671.1 hypothetical protein [Phaeodactylibacter sp.]MCI5093700.1 hypothetical protein [Phaeodactylibacter sp.]
MWLTRATHRNFGGNIPDHRYFEYTSHLSLAYWYKRYRVELSYIHGLGLRNREREMLRPINELNLTLIVQFKAPWSGKGRRGMELRF